VGQPVTFIVRVLADALGLGIPPGAVTFFRDGWVFATVALNAGGMASVMGANLTAGRHQIFAKYAGNASYLGSTAAWFKRD
jgi:hypothetical protein